MGGMGMLVRGGITGAFYIVFKGWAWKGWMQSKQEKKIPEFTSSCTIIGVVDDKIV